MSDTPEQRYSRQVQFAPLGREGHERIRHSCVAVIGMGALGTVVAEILVRAGIGQLRAIDRDVVEWSNLQRQSLYEEADAAAGTAKAAAAEAHLRRLNGDVAIEAAVIDISPSNIDRTLEGSDLVIDCCDNFSLRFLLNDWSLERQTPWVHGGCVGGQGQVMFFRGRGKPCFRCLVPQPPPPSAVATCDTAGVIGGATHAIASLQSIEAVKWLSGNRRQVRSSLWSFDFWSGRSRDVEVPATLSATCRACGEGQRDFLDSAPEPAETLCGRNAVQLAGGGTETKLEDVARRWQGLGTLQANRFFVRLRIDGDRALTLFRDGRLIVDGTDQIAEARSIRDRYLGG